MTIVKGERFYLDLDSDDEDHAPDRSVPVRPSAGPAFDFIADVTERQPSAPKPPTAPTFKKTASGFPAPKTRPRVSAFKQQRHGSHRDKHETLAAPSSLSPTGGPSKYNVEPENESPEARERRDIDMENKQRVAQMSPEEIERERQELFAGLNPSLIEKLLKRSNLDVTRQDFANTTEPSASPSSPRAIPDTIKDDSASGDASVKRSPKQSKSVTFAPESVPLDEETIATKQTEGKGIDPNENSQAPNPPDIPPPSSVHFPRAPQPPDLDPDDPSFLDNLHEKYFPDLSYDPSSLSWMAPIDAAKPSSYSLTQSSLMISALRFSFKGALIPPTKAVEIPVTEGLHHHGEAPEAAGYTIPELAILARSAVAAQRCMAYQTMGRLLYRLGKGEFGSEGERKRYNVTAVDAEGGEIREEADEEDDDRSGLAKGLWECIEEHNIIGILSEEANKTKGHMSSISYAQEALWNWRQGGGRQRKAV
ncbi:hypothetical protein EJ05DRAFT_500671 [Pseudovirgaria hyperparasitica]|uniref:Transcription factor Rba50 n=1 Tax=Pseudovirgaria hyperparasitica TaxID=470096 RepID=A0A6A6W800_9PEZI|nr:uncharacterized protein EJ05DRAFT_500671 [Pseudovirgaria hyperparasitica]KAF2758154.1 hypothetical protein EJ05DRAFT_500671 [Pseudovirgaria hyperparasitica]